MPCRREPDLAHTSAAHRLICPISILLRICRTCVTVLLLALAGHRSMHLPSLMYEYMTPSVAHCSLEARLGGLHLDALIRHTTQQVCEITARRLTFPSFHPYLTTRSCSGVTCVSHIESLTLELLAYQFAYLILGLSSPDSCRLSF